MYNGNSRFNQLANNVVTEDIASQTQLFYDPITQSCRAIFNGSAYMPVTDPNGGPTEYLAVGNKNDILHVDFTDKMTDILCVEGDYDPVTQVPLHQISVYGVMIIMKRAYDKYHNAREQARLAAIAAAEAAAAAAAAPPQGGELPPPEEPAP